MKQPKGYEERGPTGEPWVCRLKKGLYGLKQSGRLWYQKLRETLDRLGFKQIKSDPSIDIWFTGGVLVIPPIFVDDVTIVSQDKEKINVTKAAIGKYFKIKDLGPTLYLLGIKIEYDQQACRLQLSKEQYIADMLHRSGMTACKPSPTPMDPGIKLSKLQCPSNDEEARCMQHVPYMSAVVRRRSNSNSRANPTTNCRGRSLTRTAMQITQAASTPGAQQVAIASRWALGQSVGLARSKQVLPSHRLKQSTLPLRLPGPRWSGCAGTGHQDR